MLGETEPPRREGPEERLFYEPEKAKNGENGAMRLIVFPKTKHEVNMQMIKNTVDWFYEKI